VSTGVGDFGPVPRILGLFWATGSFGFEDIRPPPSQALADGKRLSPGGGDRLPVVFMGPNAKSAQFPLHAVPDAWRGPPRSPALIQCGHDGGVPACSWWPALRRSTFQFEEVQAFIAVIGTIPPVSWAPRSPSPRCILKRAWALAHGVQLGYMSLAMDAAAPVARDVPTS